ncbi:MAG: chemotaxis protein CheW [Haloarcula sp.]
MSDDERMDRAERIRRMREGNKAETADDEDDSSVAEQSSDADTDSGDAAGESTGAGQSSGETAGEDTTAATDDADPMAAAQRAAEASAQLAGETGDTAVADQPTDDLSVSTNPMQGPSGVELPDQELIEEAMDSSAPATTEGGARAATIDSSESTQTEERVRVLEFALGEEYYCIDISYVEEIVKRETVTRVPNTDEYVEGVVDLRGQITTILDPKEMMDIDTDGSQTLIVVFDPDVFEEQGAMGWVVDEVRQVVPVAESDVNTAPVDGEYINGVVDRDSEDEFVIWVEPDDVLGNAIADDED